MYKDSVRLGWPRGEGTMSCPRPRFLMMTSSNGGCGLGAAAPTAAPLPARGAGVVERAREGGRDVRLPMDEVSAAAGGRGLSTEGWRELASLLAARLYRSILLSLLGGRL